MPVDMPSSPLRLISLGLTGFPVFSRPSVALLPQDGQIAEDDLQKAVEQAGVNGVLITRMVGRHDFT